MNVSELRKQTSLQQSIVDLLNMQIGMEAHSCASYLAMSSWCEYNGLEGAGSYFRKQSNEEREHQLKIFDYLVDMGAYALSPDITNVENHFDDLKAIFDKALEMEISITASINKISAACHAENDFQTAKFLHWFLEEQMEEEKQARRCIELYELIGTANDGLFNIDHQIAKLAKGE
ncbi:MAG: ferritin [Cytophagales bacterium]|nr:ferritin [Cytophaga sp.]